MFTQAFAAAFIALFAKSAFASDCARSYTIKEGDWCDKISAEQNVSTFQLAAINPQINAACDNLAIGESLCLGTAGQDCNTTYPVQAGDTCEKIASVFWVNTTILYLNNPQINSDCSNIYVGEVLCTSCTVQVPPIPATGLPAATIPAGATPANTASGDDCDDEPPVPSPTPTSGDDDCDDEAPTSTSAPAPTSASDDCDDDAPTPAPTPTPSSSAPASTSDSDDCDDDVPTPTPTSSADDECDDEAPTPTPTSTSAPDDGDLPWCTDDEEP